MHDKPARSRVIRPKSGQTLIRDGGERFTLGRLAFEKISAVEGIRLDDGMKQDLRRAVEETPTPEAARRMLAEKYGRTTG